MQNQKHPSGQNQGYRYNGNNGTESGGAGGGYPATAMRLCPPGPGQPGTQQQDPKQQVPQTITGTMPLNYSQTQRGQNQYYQRQQRFNPPRLTSVGNMPVANISYVPGGQSVYSQVVSPIMVQQIQYQIPQASGARHQTHAPAPTATAGPASGSFYTQPPPQGTIFIQPQLAPPTPYYGQPSHLYNLPAIRNSYPANSSSNQMSTQQPPPTAVAGGANQGMMPLGIQPGGGPPPQVMAGATSGAQLTGQPGPLVDQTGGAGGSHLVCMPTQQKNKKMRPKALMIQHPVTGADVIAEMMAAESGSNSNVTASSTEHYSQMMQESADLKGMKAKKDTRRPTVPSVPIVSSVSIQQHHAANTAPTTSSTVSSNLVVGQVPSVVTPAVQQPPPLAPPKQPTAVPISQPVVVTANTNATTTSTTNSTTTKKDHQVVLPPPTAQSTLPPPQSTQKSSFAESISLDVKNFVIPQPQKASTSATSASSMVSGTPSSTVIEQKERNGETDVHDSSAAGGAHIHALHGPNSAFNQNSTRIMERKRKRKSKTRNNNSSTQHTSRRRNSRDHTTINNNEPIEVLSPVVSPHDLVGGKAQQRQKQSKQLKNKTLNRKGVEKEGTDMDAFVEAIATPPSATPSALTTTAVKSSETTSSLETATTTTSFPSSKQTTAPLTSDDSDSSSIEAMVAAKNQENTKVSALLNNNNLNNNNNNNNNNININSSNNNNNNSSTITESDNNNTKGGDDDVQMSTASDDSSQTSTGNVILETVTIEKSQPPQLAYNYKEGQWSPINKDGKKIYDREFLLEVRKNPLSSKKPSNQIDPDVLRDKPYDGVSSNNNNKRVMSSNSISIINRGDHSVPGFMRSSQSQRSGAFSNTMQFAQLMSKGGRGSSGSGPRMGGGGSMSGSMRDRDRMIKGGSSYGGSMMPYRDEPALHKTAHSWKPSRNQDLTDKTEEDIKTEKLLKAVRGILNKLTPQKFETLVNQILSLPIDTNERLTKVVYLVFSKAVDEPSFSKEYAELCNRLSLNKTAQQQQQQQQQQAQEGGGEQPKSQQPFSFKKLLISKCQEEFEKNKKDELDIEARTKEIDDCTDTEKKKELKLLLEEEERKIRIKKVGLVRFIGELFKLKMLTDKIMHGCINSLLYRIDEESLECLCKLLTTIGKELQLMSEKKEFDHYFQKMLKLSQKSPEPLVSSRIRFMLQDVIELRLNNWVPRRDENNPKTIEEIHKDAERENLIESALLSSQGSCRSGGGGGRHDSRDDRRGGRQRGGVQSEDGWLNVGAKNYTKNYPLDSSKLMPFKEIDSSVSLGPCSGWTKQWEMGVSSKKSNTQQVHINNKYAALCRADQEDRKPSITSMINRRGITPTPSLEKDRSFGAKESASESSRNNVNSSGSGRSGNGSGPPSRESSRLRTSGSSSLNNTTTSNSNSGSVQPHTTTNMVSSSTSSSSTPTNSTVSQTPTPPVVAQPTPDTTESIPALSEEEIEWETKTVIVEWFDNNNIKETIQTIQETFRGVDNLSAFLSMAFNYSLDVKNFGRPKTGQLVVALVQENIVPHETLVKEFAEFIKMGDDYKVDIPHVWRYFGELIAPIIAQEVFSFSDLRTIGNPVRPCKGFATTLAEIIRILIKDKGPGWIRTQWESSRVQMNDFVPEEDLDKFIKDNDLGFIMGVGEVQSVTDTSITPLMVEDKIISFFAKDNDKVLDHIGEWLNVNVGEKTKEEDFIKALTRAVIKASLKPDERISSAKLTKNEKLIKKFVDNDEDRELACIYSIQNLLVNELVKPPCVLLDTFQTLYENGTISRDAFLRWKEDTDMNKSEKEIKGKGVALASLQSFFVSLSEQDDTDDETSPS